MSFGKRFVLHNLTIGILMVVVFFISYNQLASLFIERGFSSLESLYAATYVSGVIVAVIMSYIRFILMRIISARSDSNWSLVRAVKIIRNTGVLYITLVSVFWIIISLISLIVIYASGLILGMLFGAIITTITEGIFQVIGLFNIDNLTFINMVGFFIMIVLVFTMPNLINNDPKGTVPSFNDFYHDHKDEMPRKLFYACHMISFILTASILSIIPSVIG